ncbi:glycerol-1-phosphate dehydrogenase [Thermocladium modestius]|uniref:Glycerol-1-phosphate dehydrogenase [NAD(P)+] n=1 Tax=Thermocladium modestius TaxID=62609 RepID=A0A830GVH2_9CREN|nr:sn-glycerol-1-phosphate dehydrogenase [Thermocladium modestius]GGP20410.1 glycerol-1-phosphate dehydrogenase [Thermocladium modestius]
MKELEELEIPRYTLFGPGAIERLNKILDMLKLGNNALLLTGITHSKKVVDRSRNDAVIEELDDVNAQLIEELVKKHRNVDAVISIGGGRIVDAGKAVAFILDKPFISVPTVASHDGIASPYVSYTLQLELMKMGFPKVRKTPLAIIADTSIITEAPRRYLIAGIGELIGKLIAVKDWELGAKIKGEEYSEYAATLALSSYQIIMRNRQNLRRHDEVATRIVVKALIGCGVAMAIAGSSRPCSGSEHLFSHALDLLSKERRLHGALHGEQVALGSIVMAYLHGLNWRRIKRVMQELGIPVKLADIGIDKETALQALTMAHTIRPDRYTILGTDGITRKAAEAALEATELV